MPPRTPSLTHLCETAWLKHAWHQHDVSSCIDHVTQRLVIPKHKPSILQHSTAQHGITQMSTSHHSTPQHITVRKRMKEQVIAEHSTAEHNRTTADTASLGSRSCLQGKHHPPGCAHGPARLPAHQTLPAPWGLALNPAAQTDSHAQWPVHMHTHGQQQRQQQHGVKKV